MALGATLYVFNIDLADADRGIYQPLELRIARHPSESAEYMLTRVLAYCCEYDEGIEFSNGLSEPDAPTIAIRDLSGVLRAWIEVGAPDAERLHRASKAAPRVAVYTHKHPAPWTARLRGERIHRSDALELYAVDRAWLAAFAAKLARRMSFSLTLSERHVYLALGEETLSCVLERVTIAVTEP
jgi:uncharacterized protein YaeQ